MDLDLRAWRVAHNLSRQELAWLLRVSPRTIVAWEQGRRAGPPGEVMSWALQALGAAIENPDDRETRIACSAQAMDDQKAWHQYKERKHRDKGRA